jgi:diguanylate cyclase (GGDEF)-like protein
MTAPALGARMVEDDLLDDDLRALDRLAEERGAAGLPSLQAAVERMRNEGDRDRLMWVLPPLSRTDALCEKFDEAEAAANEALAHFRVSGSVRGQAFALNTLGIVLNDIGRLSEAVQIFEEGLRASRGFQGERVALRLRSNQSLALGRWALKDHDERASESAWRPRAGRAVELMDFPLSQWREQKKWMEISGALDHLAIAHIVLGNLAAAHAALDEAESLMDASAPHSMVFFACVRARAHLHADEPLLALQAIERGRVAADSRGGHIHMDELYRLMSLAHESRGEWREALVAHKRFHELRAGLVPERAEQQASALAVALNTERALRQVSEERDRAERAHLEARHDQLTGLANRRKFDEFLAGMLPRACIEHPVSLVPIDLDHFKSINDRYRHLAGDAALRRVATHLQAQCRRTDLPARLGGDEFALVLTAPLAVAHQVCNRLRVAVAERVTGLPSDVTIRLSAGIAEAAAPCDSLHPFKRADEASYAAKAAVHNDIQDARHG